MPERWNHGVTIAATGVLGAVAGFAYGRGLPDDFFEWLHHWQALTGAMLTVSIAMIAATLVWRTLRFNVMAREETRIEDDLPGLRQAQEWLSNLFLYSRGMIDAMSVLRTLPGFLNLNKPFAI